MRIPTALAVASVIVTADVGCQLVAGIDSRSLGTATGDAGASAGGGTDGGGGGGAAPSCATPGVGTSTCGAARVDGCCTSDLLPSGSYERPDGNDFKPATMSAVRLDRYEVTVGRFRPFVAAVAAGFRPASGAGRHTHLGGGAGLAVAGGGTEAGWDAAWGQNLSALGSTPSALVCDVKLATWTPSAGPDDDRPIVCVTWFEAYAFCIWDGGFLPSEAEWGYAAEGGSEGRKYPWSVPPLATDIDCSFADYDACGGKVVAVGSDTHGSGKWGQADLAGNAWEWVLDVSGPFPAPCLDCASVSAGTTRTHRGGSYVNSATGIYSATRDGGDVSLRSASGGVRCARLP